MILTPRPVVPVLAALVVLTAGAGAYAAVAAPVPVSLGGTSQRPSIGTLLEPPFVQAVAIVPARAGGEFDVVFNVTNTGNRDVRITGVPERFHDPLYVDEAGVQIGDGDPNELKGGSQMGWVDFRPFDLPPGQFRMLRLRYRFADCRFHPSGLREWEGTLATGSGLGWTHQVVEYRYWGLSRSVELELPYAVFLDGAGGAC